MKAIKFLKVFRNCLFFACFISIVLMVGFVGGIDGGQPFLQNMFYCVCSFVASVIFLFFGLKVDMKIQKM